MPTETTATPAAMAGSATAAGRDGLDHPFRAAPGDPAQTRELERLVEAGMLRRLPGAVLVADHVPDTALLRGQALGLALAPPGGRVPTGPAARAVIGYATAAWLHTGGPPPETLDLIIAPGTARPKGLAVRLHEHRLHPHEVQAVARVRVTDPARTAADLARGLEPARVGAALERLGAVCGVRLVDVLDQLDRMPRARGVARARQVVLSWGAALASLPAQERDAEPVIR